MQSKNPTSAQVSRRQDPYAPPKGLPGLCGEALKAAVETVPKVLMYSLLCNLTVQVSLGLANPFIGLQLRRGTLNAGRGTYTGLTPPTRIST